MPNTFCDCPPDAEWHQNDADSREGSEDEDTY